MVTVHEGVAARAMEKKGIISDRCELNRQIKADNALLRKLRGQVKKLAMAVKNTIPALAEAMENLRKICCCSAISWGISARARNA